VLAARGFGGEITAAFAARKFAADIEFIGFANVEPAHGGIVNRKLRAVNGFVGSEARAGSNVGGDFF
jgi:hypothetical protein